jgi:hypothetical protein
MLLEERARKGPRAQRLTRHYFVRSSSSTSSDSDSDSFILDKYATTSSNLSTPAIFVITEPRLCSNQSGCITASGTSSVASESKVDII